MTFMRHVIKLLSLILFALPVFAQPVAAAERQMTVAGHRVILVSPDNLGNAPAPLLLALHGGGGSAAQFRRASGFDTLTRRAGVRVVYVDGSPLGPRNRAFTWNAGECCGPAVRRNDNDLGALEQVIATLQPLLRGAPLWIAGHSNGAMMAYRMACESRADIVGIVPISGSLMVERCPQARGVQAMHIHGRNDQNVPMAGGVGPKSRAGVAFRAVDDSLAILAAAGASPRLLVLEGAAHDFAGLNAAAKAETGQTLAGLVAAQIAASAKGR